MFPQWQSFTFEIWGNKVLLAGHLNALVSLYAGAQLGIVDWNKETQFEQVYTAHCAENVSQHTRKVKTPPSNVQIQIVRDLGKQ